MHLYLIFAFIYFSILGKLFVVAAKRTAFGKNGGKLKGHTATDLAVIAAKAALQQSAIKPEYVDHVVFGQFFPAKLSVRKFSVDSY